MKLCFLLAEASCVRQFSSCKMIGSAITGLRLPRVIARSLASPGLSQLFAHSNLLACQRRFASSIVSPVQYHPSNPGVRVVTVRAHAASIESCLQNALATLSSNTSSCISADGTSSTANGLLLCFTHGADEAVEDALADAAAQSTRQRRKGRKRGRDALSEAGTFSGALDGAAVWPSLAGIAPPLIGCNVNSFAQSKRQQPFVALTLVTLPPSVSVDVFSSRNGALPALKSRSWRDVLAGDDSVCLILASPTSHPSEHTTGLLRRFTNILPRSRIAGGTAVPVKDDSDVGLLFSNRVAVQQDTSAVGVALHGLRAAFRTSDSADADDAAAADAEVGSLIDAIIASALCDVEFSGASSALFAQGQAVQEANARRGNGGGGSGGIVSRLLPCPALRPGPTRQMTAANADADGSVACAAAASAPERNTQPQVTVPVPLSTSGPSPVPVLKPVQVPGPAFVHSLPSATTQPPPLPLFLLGKPMMPGQIASFNIFEPRYQLMLRQHLAQGRMFAVCEAPSSSDDDGIVTWYAAMAASGSSGDHGGASAPSASTVSAASAAASGGAARSSISGIPSLLPGHPSPIPPSVQTAWDAAVEKHNTRLRKLLQQSSSGAGGRADADATSSSSGYVSVRSLSDLSTPKPRDGSPVTIGESTLAGTGTGISGVVGDDTSVTGSSSSDSSRHDAVRESVLESLRLRKLAKLEKEKELHVIGGSSRRVCTVVYVREIQSEVGPGGSMVVQLEGIRRVELAPGSSTGSTNIATSTATSSGSMDGSVGGSNDAASHERMPVGGCWVAPGTSGLVHGVGTWLDDDEGLVAAAAAVHAARGDNHSSVPSSSSTSSAPTVAGAVVGRADVDVDIAVAAADAQDSPLGIAARIRALCEGNGEAHSVMRRLLAAQGAGAIPFDAMLTAPASGSASAAAEKNRVASCYTGPEGLSWWLASHLSLTTRQLRHMLECTSTAERLRMQLSLLEQVYEDCAQKQKFRRQKERHDKELIRDNDARAAELAAELAPGSSID